MSADSIDNSTFETTPPVRPFFRQVRDPRPNQIVDRENHSIPPMGVWHLDLQRGSEYWSPECAEILGADYFDGTLAMLQTLLEPDSAGQLMASIAEAIQHRRDFAIGLRMAIALGFSHQVFCRGRCNFDENGTPIQVLGIVHEVSAGISADTKVTENESRLRATIDNLLEGCQILDSQLRYVYLNSIASRHGRRPAEDLIGRKIIDAYPGVETTAVYTAIVQCLKERIPSEMENRFVFPDGSVGVYELRILPASDGVVILSHETTERKQAEESLRRSENRLKTAQQLAGIGVWDWDCGEGLRWSDELYHIYGRDPKTFQVSLTTAMSLVPTDARPQLRLALQQVIESGTSYKLQHRIVRADGVERWLDVDGVVERDSNKRPIRMWGVCHDITELKAVEGALRVSEERFQLALRGANDGLWDWNIKTNHIFLSPRWKSQLGYADAEIVENRETWLEMMHPDDRVLVKERVREFIEGPLENFETEFRMRHKSGEYRNILSRSFVIRDEQGKPIRMVGTHQDITDRKLADEELRASRRRLETLSRQLITTREVELRHLARELHDEIGQSLTLMKMNLRDIQRSSDENIRTRLDENVSMIERAVKQVRNLSLNMRPPHLDDLGLVATLHWYLKQQARIAGFRERLIVIPAEIRVPDDLVIVCFRISQEAVTNAMRHAAAAEIEIELRQTDDALHLTIIDDGKGFDVGHAFLRASKGESLGIISLQERANLAGGQAEIISAVGQGTRIHAWFPLESTPR